MKRLIGIIYTALLPGSGQLVFKAGLNDYGYRIDQIELHQEYAWQIVYDGVFLSPGAWHGRIQGERRVILDPTYQPDRELLYLFSSQDASYEVMDCYGKVIKSMIYDGEQGAWLPQTRVASGS